ncbi:MAG: putative VFL3 protein, partial [Streblomastix strix]
MSSSTFTIQKASATYELNIINDIDSVQITVEDEDEGNEWRGEFTAKEIEEITLNTGSFRKYPIFMKMLIRSLKQKTEQLSTDLLTHADLQELQQRVSKGAVKPKQSKTKNLFLILSYQTDFDKVHYVLCLGYIDGNNPEQLKKRVSKLQSELISARDQLEQVQKENQKLKKINQQQKDKISEMQGELRSLRTNIRNNSTPVRESRSVSRGRIDQRGIQTPPNKIHHSPTTSTVRSSHHSLRSVKFRNNNQEIRNSTKSNRVSQSPSIRSFHSQSQSPIHSHSNITPRSTNSAHSTNKSNRRGLNNNVIQRQSPSNRLYEQGTSSSRNKQLSYFSPSKSYQSSIGRSSHSKDTPQSRVSLRQFGNKNKQDILDNKGSYNEIRNIHYSKSPHFSPALRKPTSSSPLVKQKLNKINDNEDQDTSLNDDDDQYIGKN